MRDSAETRYDRKWLPRDERVEMKLNALLAVIPGALERYGQALVDRFPDNEIEEG